MVGSLVQESNTFSPLGSDLSIFENGFLRFGAEGLREMAGKGTEVGGFIAAGKRAGVALVPTVVGWAPSGGPMAAGDSKKLAESLLGRVSGAGRVDGVLLALHGAWASEQHLDADGWLLGEVRRVVGPDVPVVVSLDLHANVTGAMVRAADALVGYKSYPHVDMFETGVRAAELLFRTLRRGAKPGMAVTKVPMLVPPENAGTDRGPLSELWGEAQAWERGDEGRLASIFTVQPWLDVPELGCAVVTVGPGGDDGVEADALARGLWERRRRFTVPLAAPEEAVERALASSEGPVLLVDSSDSVSSGSPGDGTALLRALLDAKPRRPALVTVVDPEAAREAVAADGREATLTVGGRLDPGRNEPVSLTARCRKVAEGRVGFTAGVGDGLTADLGLAAVIEVGGLRVLLMENPVPCYDPALYRAVGLEPSEAQAVVVKSPNNFRWTYRGIARERVYVDAPGASTPKLSSLDFRRAPRPLYPFEDWNWTPDGKARKGGVHLAAP